MNVFGDIRPQSDPPVPYRLPQLCVFVQLTNGHGEIVARIKVYHLDTDTVIFTGDAHTIKFRDPPQTKWVFFRLKDCSFPDFGISSIELRCGGLWVADQIIRVLE
jgi:hypothetical protein